MRDIEGEVDYVVVVNEPYIEIDRPNDPFWEKLGYDYIDIAFQAAREVNPEIELIYNDSMNQSLADPDENGYTTSLTRRVTSRLKEKGLVDAVGMQMHIRAGNPPTKDDIIATMRSYEIPVHVTECDVDLSDIRGSQEDRLTLQAKIYRDIIAACIESGVCKSITFWGNGDDTSWLEVNSGRRNADPTLFISLPNGESAPKSAYYAIADLLLQSILNKK
jgi:endo-1,4-beta-xylanase